MGNTIQQSLPPMELQRVQEGSRTVPKSVQDWRGCVVRAMGRAGLSQKQMAADLGVTPSQLSGQLSGRNGEHLSLWRMFSLSREFWQEFVLLIIDFYDLQIGMVEQDRRDCELGRTVREALERRLAR